MDNHKTFVFIRQPSYLIMTRDLYRQATAIQNRLIKAKLRENVAHIDILPHIKLALLCLIMIEIIDAFYSLVDNLWHFNGFMV